MITTLSRVSMLADQLTGDQLRLQRWLMKPGKKSPLSLEQRKLIWLLHLVLPMQLIGLRKVWIFQQAILFCAQWPTIMQIFFRGLILKEEASGLFLQCAMVSEGSMLPIFRIRSKEQRLPLLSQHQMLLAPFNP